MKSGKPVKSSKRTKSRVGSGKGKLKFAKKSPPIKSTSQKGKKFGGRVGLGKRKETALQGNVRLVVGHHACLEALKIFPQSVQKILVQSDWATRAELRKIVEEGQKRNYPIQEVSEERLGKICKSHQGMCLELNNWPQLNDAIFDGPGHGLLVALDGIVDPHNLGAMMRTLWLMGGNGVLLPQDRSVGLNATASKVASGGAEHIPVTTVSNLPESLDRYKKMGFWIYGLSSRASAKLWDLKLPEKCIWVVGSEGQGIRKSVEKKCDELVTIPQVCADASYNASVSLSLALGETVRQWAQLGPVS